MEAKRRIHKFNFDQDTMQSGDAVHVGLVDKAANMTEVVTMKAAEYTTSSLTREKYNDDGSYECDEDTISVIDYGEDMVRVTNETVSIREQYIRVR